MPDGGMVPQQEDKLPFRRNTRQRIRRVGTTQSVAGGGSALGQTITFQLDRVGLLNALVVVLRGTVTLAGAGAFATLGPWSIFNRLRVDLNLGNMNLVDVSGFLLYQLNRRLFRGWGPDGAGVYTPSATLFNAPLAMGANSWIIPLVIPISANFGSQFDTGLISLQSPEIQVNVELRLANAGADFTTQFTSLTATTIELYSIYYEYPDPSAVFLPPSQVIRTVEFSQPFSAVGDVVYTIDRQGTLLHLISVMIANAVRSNGMDGVRLDANINDTIYNLNPFIIQQLLTEMNNSSAQDTGVAELALWHAGENPSCHDDRDVIDTEVLTTLRWIPTISSGTALGAGTNFWNTLRRVVVDFEQPGLGPSL